LATGQYRGVRVQGKSTRLPAVDKIQTVLRFGHIGLWKSNGRQHVPPIGRPIIADNAWLAAPPASTASFTPNL
jgi:hypothetical protein